MRCGSVHALVNMDLYCTETRRPSPILALPVHLGVEVAVIENYCRELLPDQLLCSSGGSKQGARQCLKGR